MVEPNTIRTLVLGGVRSGKSRLAEQMAVESGRPVTYVATAGAGDAEMADRIRAHQARRPASWGLEEERLDLAAVLRRHAPSGSCLLVDCMSLWLGNLLHQQRGGVDDAVSAFLEALSAYPGPLVVVSNEVGLGIIGMDPLTRRFADRLGRLNQELAARCDRVVLAVAGLSTCLKGQPARPA